MACQHVVFVLILGVLPAGLFLVRQVGDVGHARSRGTFSGRLVYTVPALFSSSRVDTDHQRGGQRADQDGDLL